MLDRGRAFLDERSSRSRPSASSRSVEVPGAEPANLCHLWRQARRLFLQPRYHEPLRRLGRAHLLLSAVFSRHDEVNRAEWENLLLVSAPFRQRVSRNLWSDRPCSRAVPRNSRRFPNRPLLPLHHASKAAVPLRDSPSSLAVAGCGSPIRMQLHRYRCQTYPSSQPSPTSFLETSGSPDLASAPRGRNASSRIIPRLNRLFCIGGIEMCRLVG